MACIPNPPLPAEGCASFSNYHLAGLIVLVPFFVQRWFIPYFTGWTSYFILAILMGLPIAIAYWTAMSKFGPRLNEKVPFPGRPQEDYIEIKSSTMDKWRGKKIPMQIFHDAYFEGKVDFKGDVLDVMEYRHDWASMEFTPEVCHFSRRRHGERGQRETRTGV